MSSMFIAENDFKAETIPSKDLDNLTKTGGLISLSPPLGIIMLAQLEQIKVNIRK